MRACMSCVCLVCHLFPTSSLECQKVHWDSGHKQECLRAEKIAQQKAEKERAEQEARKMEKAQQEAGKQTGKKPEGPLEVD